MTEYDALKEILKDSLHRARKEMDEARVVYRRVRKDPSSSPLDIESAKMDRTRASGRWALIEGIMNDLDYKVECKVRGMEY